MTNAPELKFESPTFKQRIKGMLGVDFYRLFHTPLFYIFLGIAAIIPAMLIAMTGMEGPNGEPSQPLFTNVWQAIAADTPIYGFEGIDKYANMNMVFIFGGIMVSIFIGHDYQSGYVKQLFTTHAKKQDYMISKTLSCTFAMACMCVTYLFGAIVAGLLTRTSFDVNVGNLLCAILGKMIMSLGWASLYTFLNVILRKYFGVSIASSFFFGTGILVIGVGSIVGDTPILNVFLYGSSVFACLTSNLWTIINCLLVSLAWTVIYILVGSHILNRSDVY
ncbi:MAG: ABC transporter permease [Clostridia bacterium]|nr:ABC transporter permease [Clostridia bacterium]MBQ3042695.1 ABC transporter permease [Clostridia bacterium]